MCAKGKFVRVVRSIRSPNNHRPFRALKVEFFRRTDLETAHNFVQEATFALRILYLRIRFQLYAVTQLNFFSSFGRFVSREILESWIFTNYKKVMSMRVDCFKTSVSDYSLPLLPLCLSWYPTLSPVLFFSLISLQLVWEIELTISVCCYLCVSSLCSEGIVGSVQCVDFKKYLYDQTTQNSSALPFNFPTLMTYFLPLLSLVMFITSSHFLLVESFHVKRSLWLAFVIYQVLNIWRRLVRST